MGSDAPRALVLGAALRAFAMTPEEVRRAQRRDAGLAFVGIAVLVVLLIGGGMLAVLWLEWEVAR